MSDNIPQIQDLKAAHRGLSNLPDEDLALIKILPGAALLTPGDSYLDLKNIEQGEFVAGAQQQAGDDNWYVAKSELPVNLWNLLLGLNQHEMNEQQANRQGA
jgi:hypothetical protein